MPLPADKKPLTPEKAMLRLETRCARSEMCSREAMEKMARWGLPAAEASAILDSLKARKFIDDARFARAFVRDKYRFQRWGRRKITYALALKRISRPMIDEALAEIDEREYREILAGLIAARARAIGADACTYEGRTRLFRAAASRGYETEFISAELKKYV
ncbi:MAG: RecX family transcriptional regulator [Muribaculaceae bacterium]|nr:RecX family transcriptional regulator [Muribaculaceae bacterium]